MLLIALTMALVAALVFAALFYFNVHFAATTPASVRFSGIDNVIELPPPDLIDPLVKRMLLPATGVLGLMALPQGAANWEPLSLFLNPTHFNLRDPQFGLDLGFYIFRLPALQIFYQSLMFALALTTIATAAVYLVYRGIAYSPRGLFITDRAKSHLLILLAAILVVKAGGYYLDAFELLYSPRGVAFGASYADINATLPALRVLLFLALLAALLCLVQAFREGYRYVLLGIACLAGVHLVGLNAYPALLQRFRVAPNEAVAERPFIERIRQHLRTFLSLSETALEEELWNVYFDTEGADLIPAPVLEIPQKRGRLLLSKEALEARMTPVFGYKGSS